MFTVHAFYCFVPLPDYRSLRTGVLDACCRSGLIGTILLAEEGINGTIAGSPEGLDAFWKELGKDVRLAGIQPRVSEASHVPFYRMKVRLKKEIVTMGVPGIDPNREVGTYVPPGDWNDLISDPGVCVLDTRNDYEVAIGTFKGAVNPHTMSFRDFPRYVDEEMDPSRQPRVAMFCTGGIRCEKASAYLLEKGFKEVYHLEGGILKYLEEVPEEESLWEGECFVFDQRVAVEHGLQEGSYDLCHGCRRPLSPEDRASPRYEPGVTCPACYDDTNDQKKSRARERDRQVRLAEERNQQHLGQQPEKDAPVHESAR